MTAFIPKDKEADIIAAIEKAETNTSGEIRLHVEAKCSGEALDRAKKLFVKLEMEHTAARNGVLLYIAWKDRKTAIFGDIAIHEKVGQEFWEEDIHVLTDHFKQGKVAEGIIEVIHRVGDKLKEHFPFQSDDKNELSNEISFGDHE